MMDRIIARVERDPACHSLATWKRKTCTRAPLQGTAK